jgi:restriction system protein
VGEYIFEESRTTSVSSAWRLHYHGPGQKCSRKKSSQDRPETLGAVSGILGVQSQIEAAYAKIRGELKNDLLDRLKMEALAVFERIVIELLVKMGYGGSRVDAAQAIGKAGDEGLDGIIKEDRLGLDIIYVQAKRWAATVGRPEIQKFAGALHGQHATKGIFITTSDFSREANDYVSKIMSKIVLIDGSRLAELMIEFGVAVATQATYTVKRIDNDFFESI